MIPFNTRSRPQRLTVTLCHNATRDSAIPLCMTALLGDASSKELCNNSKDTGRVIMPPAGRPTTDALNVVEIFTGRMAAHGGIHAWRYPIRACSQAYSRRPSTDRTTEHANRHARKVRRHEITSSFPNRYPRFRGAHRDARALRMCAPGGGHDSDPSLDRHADSTPHPPVLFVECPECHAHVRYRVGHLPWRRYREIYRGRDYSSIHRPRSTMDAGRH